MVADDVRPHDVRPRVGAAVLSGHEVLGAFAEAGQSFRMRRASWKHGQAAVITAPTLADGGAVARGLDGRSGHGQISLRQNQNEWSCARKNLPCTRPAADAERQ